MMDQEVIGDALPTAQQRILRVLTGAFKVALITGVVALIGRAVDIDLVTDITRLLHQVAGYALAALFCVFAGLHFAYALTLRGGHVYESSSSTGYSLMALGVSVVGTAAIVRFGIEQSAFSISIHVLAGILLPLFFQTHVVRASGSRGN